MRDPATEPIHRLQTFFGERLFVDALRLLDSGGVFSLNVLQAGRIATGIVGSATSPDLAQHRVYVRQSQGTVGNDRFPHPSIEGECSCGAPGHCMHVAAVAIAAARNAAAAAADQRCAPAAMNPPRSPPLAVAAAPRQQLCYLIESQGLEDGHPSALRLSLWIGQVAPGSERIEAQSACRFALRSATGSAARADEMPRYLDATARQILTALTARHHEGPWLIAGPQGAALLAQIVGTARAYWQSLRAEPLRIGDAREMPFHWQALSNGDQRLHCPDPCLVQLFRDSDAAVYLDAANHRCGEVDLPYPVRLLRHYWHRAAVPPEQVAAVNDEITRHADAKHFPRLRTFAIHRQALHSLRGKLVLSAGPSAKLHFVCNGLSIDSCRLTAAQATIRYLEASAAVLHEIDRDLDAERALHARLDRAMSDIRQDSQSWLAFMLHAVPALQSEGWEIDVLEDFPYRLAMANEWIADLDTQRREGWFDLRLGIVVDEHYANLLPALVDYLQASGASGDAACQQVGEQILIRLDDGRYVPIALERIRRIAATLVELHDSGALSPNQALSLPISQAMRVAQLALDPDAPRLRSQEHSLLASIDDLKNFDGIRPLPAPAQFGAVLRPYQEDGLGWLQFLARYRLGGILADDMGLGKTVQTLAHLWLEKTAGRLTRPALIVTPVSIIGNWQQEARRLAPQLRVLTLHGSRRAEHFARIGDVDIVITGYSLLHLDSEVLQRHEFSFLILDEAQTIKNPRAKVSQAACALRAAHRLCLTGTPMENHLGELWSLLEFLQPGFLGSQRDFQRHYRDAIEKDGDTERAAALAHRLAPVLLRRTKETVATELPAKTQIVETIVLDDAQRDFYDGIRLAMHRRVRAVIEQQGLARSQITMLDALLKLRQACCDPRLVDHSAAAHNISSAKLEWLRTVLPELVAEGRRVLLFSQFTAMLQLIEATVVELGIEYCLLSGATQHRTELVNHFQSGRIPLFLISLKAGGTGLNLTAADTVIHYDPWWNQAAEAQATDRAHRIGQTQPVFVYKLIAQGTIEEKIMQLQADKHALANQLYTAKNAAPTQLSAADWESLFAP